MGGKVSVPQSAKPEDLESYGTFKLRQSQKFALNTLSDLVTMLMSDNNLYDLADLLSTDKGCQSLIIIIKNKLEKEFTTLSFPVPLNKSEKTPVGFVSKQRYGTIAASDTDRAEYCRQFAFFIVRMILLISSLVASVAYQPDMFKSLTSTTTTNTRPTGVNERFKNLVDQGVRGEPILISTLSPFLNSGNLKKVENDNRQLYYFGAETSVVIDADKGIVYQPQAGNDTGVLKIKITPLVYAPTVPSQYLPPNPTPAPAPVPAPYPAAPAPAPYPAAAPVRTQVLQAPRIQPPRALSNAPSNSSSLNRLNPLNTLSNRISTSGSSSSRRRQRKGRKTTRRRAHRGGAIQFRVTLTSITCPESGTCDNSLDFDMDEFGNTFAVGTTVSPMSFASRVGNILNREKKRYLLENPAVLAALAKNKFTPFSNLDSTTYAILADYQNAIVDRGKSREDITSPAIYRAFLLASGFDKGILDTLFCNDYWRGLMTATVPYSLLQSLYYDQPGGTKSIDATEELRGTVSGFLKNDIARPSVQNSAELPREFSQLAFIEPRKIAPAFCGTVTSGVRPINIPAYINVLTQAHQKLHTMYDAHLQNVVKFIRKILSLKQLGYKQGFSIRLNPIFVTNTNGAQEALDILIKEGRTLLAEHYFSVEMEYKKALLDIVNLGRGVSTESSVARTNGKLAQPKPDEPVPTKLSPDPLESSLARPNA